MQCQQAILDCQSSCLESYLRGQDHFIGVIVYWTSFFDIMILFKILTRVLTTLSLLLSSTPEIRWALGSSLESEGIILQVITHLQNKHQFSVVGLMVKIGKSSCPRENFGIKLSLYQRSAKCSS